MYLFISSVFLVLTMIQGQGPSGPCSDTVNPNDVTGFVDNDITKALQGAWASTVSNEKGDRITVTKIIMDGYMAVAFYEERTGDFIKTYGGHWTVDQKSLSLTVEFSSADKAMVGKTLTSEFEFREDQRSLISEDMNWIRIDQGKGLGLNGAWLITGRKRDGQLTRRTPGDRKTMKILSGTRFQWIAYNTATGEFFGTGGGTYSANDGTYTENIEFFSRDNKRVGAQLNFHYEIKEKEWHHSGLSSKGDPIYEIWSPRIMPVKN